MGEAWRERSPDSPNQPGEGSPRVVKLGRGTARKANVSIYNWKHRISLGTHAQRFVATICDGVTPARIEVPRSIEMDHKSVHWTRVPIVLSVIGHIYVFGLVLMLIGSLGPGSVLAGQ
jgi:hypothetical protein